MRLTKKHFIGAIVLLVLLIGSYFVWQGKPEPENKKSRNPVQTIKSGVAIRKSLAVTINVNGYVTPMQTVDVRPQIQNIVRGIHVKEGQEVRAGQLLFTLDERSDAANVDKAQAQVARDRADLADAEANLKRNQDLLAKKFVSQAVVDTAQAKVDALRSTLRANQAAVQSSNVGLSYNRITAGIAGRVGAINVHPGSLVQPSGPAMVTIAQLDPISVSFSVPERELTNIRASYPNSDAPVIALLPGSGEITGSLYFIDNAADTQSGTIKMKARFENGERKLWPGTYVGIRMVSKVLNDATVIPAQAIVTGPAEKFVYSVQADDTVKAQKISIVNIENGQAAVAGLTPGTRIVIEGAQNLRPGSKVKEMQAADPKPTSQKKEKNSEKGDKSAAAK